MFIFFFFNDTATTEIYTLSLHDALPICTKPRCSSGLGSATFSRQRGQRASRSEEHTSELQSRLHLVCRLLLEKKKKKQDEAKQSNNIYIAANTNRSTTISSHPH